MRLDADLGSSCFVMLSLAKKRFQSHPFQAAQFLHETHCSQLL